jgi:hypothetical protein
MAQQKVCSLHSKWYGETNPCCMCGEHEECKSLDAEFIRADLWRKIRKMMDKWSLSADMWKAMEKGIQHYTHNTLKRDPGNMPAEPPSTFGTTFYTPRNRLKVALHAQSQIGYVNFPKGRMSHDWTTYIDHHFQENESKLTGQEHIIKLIMGLWDHMDCTWTYHNNIYHKNTTQQVARYKTEALAEDTRKYGRNMQVWSRGFTPFKRNILR